MEGGREGGRVESRSVGSKRLKGRGKRERGRGGVVVTSTRYSSVTYLPTYVDRPGTPTNEDGDLRRTLPWELA